MSSSSWRFASSTSDASLEPSPTSTMAMSSRSRRNVAARTSGSRFCACPMLPEGMTTKRSSKPGSPPQSFFPGRGVPPIRDEREPVARRPLFFEAFPHPRADCDRSVGAPQIEPDRAPQKADHDGVLEPLQLDRDLGKDVLAHDDKRRPEATGDEQCDAGDHGRVGHAEDDVRPPAPEPDVDGTEEVPPLPLCP